MASMTHRQRIVTALNHQEPDRVPVDFGATYVTTINMHAYPRLVQHLGLKPEADTPIMRRRSQTAIPGEAVLRRLDVDARGVVPGKRDRSLEKDMGEDRFSDEWGVEWARPKGGHYINVWGPFQEGEPTLADLERHAWPDPNDPGLARGLKEQARRLRDETDYAIVFNMPDAVVGACERLRGFDRFLEDLLVNKAFAQGLMEHVVEVSAGLARTCMKEAGKYVDVVMFPDDLGFQTQPLISPDLYRRMVKPYHRRLVEAIKGHTKAKAALHTDGSVYALVADLIDAGVDILNPVQVSARDMDSKRLKAQFGRNICFWGSIDTQRVLHRGTPKDVTEEVRLRIRDLAPGGGFVLASVHNLQAEVPPENVVAMIETAHRYGTYPLSAVG